VSKTLVELAKEYSSAWAVHDPDAIAAMHSDDSVFALHDVGAPAVGRAAVRDLIVALLNVAPDLRFELKRAHFGAEHFVTEYLMTGTADGKPFKIAGADVFTMRDGLVARKDTYLDWLA
jgi:ketosteroid isomerase-like protein